MSFFRRRKKLDREIDEELRFHIERRTERYLRSGLSPEEARRKALDRFGSVEAVREAVRQIELGAIETIWQDVRYGARTLAKSPGFTAVAVLSLALGIGLNSAIFSAINAVMLRPLPFKDPERIVSIGEASQTTGRPGGINPVNYLEWERQNQVFESMAVVFPFFHNNGRYVLMVGDNPVRVTARRVSASFFQQVLGVQPALGRGFLPEEDEPGVRVVVLSHELWRGPFASDPAVVGRDIALDDGSYRVVGVLPPGFRSPLGERGEVDFWLPNPFDAVAKTSRNAYGFGPMARLKPGVTLEQARAEMEVIAKSLERLYPKENKGIRLAAIPLHDSWTRRARPVLQLLLGAVGLVLLIACANVASLLLGRASARQREIAIRSAMGAARPRLVRQLLTESLLLSGAGGAAGLTLALWSANLLNRILPDRMFRLDEASLDPRVLGFTLAISVVTGLLFGLAPALAASKVDIVDVLKAAGRTASENRGGLRLRNSLVVVQMALSLVLLAGAGLMIKSLWKLYRIELGFNPGHVLTLHCWMTPTPPRLTELVFQPASPGSSTQRRYYVPNAPARQFAERVVERLEKLPGVKSAAGAVYGIPFMRNTAVRFRMEGQASLPPEQARRQAAILSAITPGFFPTLAIPLAEGRLFDERDRANTPRVAIISQTMVKTFWPQTPSVIGQRIQIGQPWEGPAGQPYEIVGVAADVRRGPQALARDTSGMAGEQVSGAHMYIPEAQSWESSYSELALLGRLDFHFLLRTQSDPVALAPAVRQAIREVDPEQPVEQVVTMDDRISEAFGPWRSTMLLLGLFAGVAVLLAAIGIYGVISYSVSQRTHEIGVRMALGAGRGEVLRLMMKGGVRLALTGILIGSVAAYWLTRLIAAQLFEVTVADPLTFSAVALVLLGVAMLACYLPARRAAALDPMAALRCE